MQERGLQRPRLQSRQFDDLRRVEAFGKDHSAPQPRRIFGDVTIGREIALPQTYVTQLVIRILPAFDHRAERRKKVLWRYAAGSYPDFIWHPPVRATELRDLTDGVVKLPPFYPRQFAAARGRRKLMSRAVDRIQLYRLFFFVEEREISFGKQRETVGRRKREVAHPLPENLFHCRLCILFSLSAVIVSPQGGRVNRALETGPRYL